MDGTAYFQFCPSTLRLSQSDGMTIAEAPSYVPRMPSSTTDWTIEQINAGK